MHRLSATEARWITVGAQRLGRDRPPDLVTTVRDLTFLQLDPTAAVAPSADLVAWSRLGRGYRPADLAQALEVDRTLYEHRAYVWPVEDLGSHLAEMATWLQGWPKARDWLAANDAFRRDTVALLRDRGPLLSREVPDTATVDWPSTGWTHQRNVTQMLEFLSAVGEIAVSARRGRQRIWDLAERVYPRDVVVPDLAAARRHRDRRRLQSLGLARPSAVGGAGEPATVDGVRGEWRVDPAALTRTVHGRTALLSPFDRLVHDRKRALELFDFDFAIELYVPAAKRRWGYYALPVLHHDRLIGKADVSADRKASVLRVHRLHPDVPWTRTVAAAVDREIADLAAWIGLESVERVP